MKKRTATLWFLGGAVVATGIIVWMTRPRVFADPRTEALRAACREHPELCYQFEDSRV